MLQAKWQLWFPELSALVYLVCEYFVVHDMKRIVILTSSDRHIMWNLQKLCLLLNTYQEPLARIHGNSTKPWKCSSGSFFLTKAEIFNSSSYLLLIFHNSISAIAGAEYVVTVTKLESGPKREKVILFLIMVRYYIYIIIIINITAGKYYLVPVKP